MENPLLPQWQTEIKSGFSKGEVLVGMKDGVEYVLRFGETYRGPEDDENSTGDSRYIYAYARVNENLLEQPVLEPVPAPLTQPKADSNSSVRHLPMLMQTALKGIQEIKGKKVNHLSLPSPLLDLLQISHPLPPHQV